MSDLLCMHNDVTYSQRLCFARSRLCGTTWRVRLRAAGGIVVRCKVAHLLHSWHLELPGLWQLPFAAQVRYCRSLGVLPVVLFLPGFRIRPDWLDHKWTALSTAGNAPKMHWGHIWDFNYFGSALWTAIHLRPHWRTRSSTFFSSIQNSITSATQQDILYFILITACYSFWENIYKVFLRKGSFLHFSKSLERFFGLYWWIRMDFEARWEQGHWVCKGVGWNWATFSPQ